jgi:hypothetical protein
MQCYGMQYLPLEQTPLLFRLYEAEPHPCAC